MKTLKTLLVAGVVLAECSCLAQARPRGGSNYGRNYIIGSEELEPWSAGIVYRSRERNVQYGSWRLPAVMKSDDILAYAGFDILPWWTLQACIGESQTEFDKQGGDDGKLAYGLSTEFNILDHEIEDWIMEDRLRINAGASWDFRETESMVGDLEWQEVTAYLTVSIINDIEGDKRLLPESLAIFAGPMYSDIVSDDIKDQEAEFGYVLGLEVFISKRVTIFGSYEAFDKDGMSAGLNLRF